MDSFYPKIDEVELVLVDDDNDFYDPLETNFECEDENEDTKLQLNDTVYENDQFHWSGDETTNHSSADENEPVNSVEIVKLENSYENCDYNNGNTTNNDEYFSESDEKIISYDTDQECFQNNNSNHTSDDEQIIEFKPNPDEILKTTIKQKQKQNKVKISKEIEENVVKTEHVQTKKKRLKTKRKKEETVTSSIEKEPKTKKKCIKEEKVVRKMSKNLKFIVYNILLMVLVFFFY